MAKTPPPRLFGLVAPEAARAVILARGPKGVSRAISWDLATDEIDEGPPIRARIYERKADLSPDGRWLIYAAFGKGPDLPFHGDGYTALSSPPSLTAEVFLPMGGTWFGGGVFASDGALSLRTGLKEGEEGRFARLGVRLAPWPPAGWPEAAPGERRFDNVHWRLLRDGWREDGGVYAKTAPDGASLTKQIDRLVERHGHPAHPDAPSWDWAEVCGDDLLVACKGELFRIDRAGARRSVALIAPAPTRL